MKTCRLTCLKAWAAKLPTEGGIKDLLITVEKLLLVRAGLMKIEGITVEEKRREEWSHYGGEREGSVYFRLNK